MTENVIFSSISPTAVQNGMESLSRTGQSPLYTVYIQGNSLIELALANSIPMMENSV